MYIVQMIKPWTHPLAWTPWWNQTLVYHQIETFCEEWHGLLCYQAGTMYALGMLLQYHFCKIFGTEAALVGLMIGRSNKTKFETGKAQFYGMTIIFQDYDQYQQSGVVWPVALSSEYLCRNCSALASWTRIWSVVFQKSCFVDEHHHKDVVQSSFRIS